MGKRRFWKEPPSYKKERKAALGMYREAYPRRRNRRKKRARIVWVIVILAVCLLVGILVLAGRGGQEAPDAQQPGDSGLTDVDTQLPPAAPPVSSEPENTPSREEVWNLILVNPWNSLPEEYSVTLVELNNGQAVDERCYPDLQAMIDACRAEGLFPVICSSYRTWEKQETLYGRLVDQLIAQGLSAENARTEAAKEIAVPGTSEHQTGLAVDIVDLNYQLLDSAQEDTPVQQWLMEHCWEYGFILRYPNGRSETTGIIYEPWHYRYVGKEAAKEITEAGLCLEEYLER